MSTRKTWLPIDTAPHDGTLLLLIVDNSRSSQDDDSNPLEDDVTSRTIGFNNQDNDGEDKWLMAGWNWQYDEFTQGHGEPTFWQHIPEKLS